VILELTDIITEPLKLPAWLLPVVIVLLSIGFIIAIILSWIYDMHPEGGIVKTESAKKVKEESVPISSIGWKIASYISFMVIVGLIVLNIIPRTSNKEILDKSIAVLPFRNDSPDESKMYFINGTMEAILNNLSMIKDIRVPGRTSVEQYRDNPKPIPIVAEEMNVSYILEGSGHRDGNNVRLIVQLLDGKKDQHLWSKIYDADIEGIFSMQSEIAQLVAAEIEAIITPKEKQLIEKIPTGSLSAYDFYQRGREAYNNRQSFNNEREALEAAEKFYYNALESDSTYAAAYAGLADVYFEKHYHETLLSETFLDSVLILTDIALAYDDQIPYTYSVRGDYYRAKGNPEQAIKVYEKAIELDPNDWYAFTKLGITYFRPLEDFQKAIVNLQEALLRNRGNGLPLILSTLGSAYLEAGFPDKALENYQEILRLTGDSVAYFSQVGFMEFSQGNFNEALVIRRRAYIMDTALEVNIRDMMSYSSFVGYHDEAFLYAEKYVKRLKETGSIALRTSHRIGYSFWQAGKYEEAETYINQQIKYGIEAIELGRESSFRKALHYDIAAAYAFQGDRANAYQYLNEFSKKPNYAVQWVTFLNNDPLFESIRDEPEFQQIGRDIEAKYQAEHERVRQWLEGAYELDPDLL